MSYVQKNYRTKKELKDAVKRLTELRSVPQSEKRDVEMRPLERDLSLQTLMHPENPNGEHTVEGPHYPEAHRWYARVEFKDGVAIKVRS